MSRQRKTLTIDDHREDVPVADLRDADLTGASLRRSNLAGAVMCGANLRECDLQGANLRRASLFSANLSRANLGGANLGMADLRFACLERANLHRVNLNRANLLGAKLAGTCLDSVDMAGAILPDGTPYDHETSLGRFTDTQNPTFAATLRAVKALRADAAQRNQEGAIGNRDMSWAQFVERTYGSLADDPIEWRPPAAIETKDGYE